MGNYIKYFTFLAGEKREQSKNLITSMVGIAWRCLVEKTQLSCSIEDHLSSSLSSLESHGVLRNVSRKTRSTNQSSKQP